jgi:hypothetical protein
MDKNEPHPDNDIDDCLEEEYNICEILPFNAMQATTIYNSQSKFLSSLVQTFLLSSADYMSELFISAYTWKRKDVIRMNKKLFNSTLA